jgi:hypothetical protein
MFCETIGRYVDVAVEEGDLSVIALALEQLHHAVVSANGDGDNDGPNSDDVPLVPSHSSCRDYLAHNSGNWRLDNTGRTCPDL